MTITWEEFQEYRELIKDTYPTTCIPATDCCWGYGIQILYTNNNDPWKYYDILRDQENKLFISPVLNRLGLYAKSSLSIYGFDESTREEMERKKKGWREELKFICNKYKFKYENPQWFYVSTLICYPGVCGYS